MFRTKLLPLNLPPVGYLSSKPTNQNIQVTGTVDFDGHALVSPALNFTAGGGVAGLSSLSVGDAGLDVSGVLSAASDVMVEGSVTVAGAVMGRGPYMDTSDARMKTEVREISAVDASAVVRGLR